MSFLGWMAWTVPTAIFFAVIALMLTGMTVWQLVSPSVERRVFCPWRRPAVTVSSSDCSGSAFIHLGLDGRHRAAPVVGHRHRRALPRRRDAVGVT